MQIVGFSGWGQKYDSLSSLYPNMYNINYSKYGDIDLLSQAIYNLQCDILIGWSLGGQLAIRSVIDKVISPRLLVLISSPFQFIKDFHNFSGIEQNIFDQFKRNYLNDPLKTVQRSSLAIAKNDRYEEEVLRKILPVDEVSENLYYWLQELERFSCSNVDFNNFPETIIVHGTGDIVIASEQAKIFEKHLPHSKLYLIDACGHAPHLHDSNMLVNIITKNYNNICSL